MIERSEEIRRLMDEGMQLSATGNKRAVKILAHLKRLGAEAEDYALSGFAAYYTAGFYYDSPLSGRFQKNLRDAVWYLLRTDEHELLARAYNLFALDAVRKGCFDIAQNYYLTALRFVADHINSPVTGIVTTNLGNLFYELGDHASARKFYRRGIHAVKQDVRYPYFYRNLMAAYINDGLNSLAMEDTDAALKAFHRAEQVSKSVDAVQLRDAQILFLFFEAQIALVGEEHDRVKALFYELSDRLQKEPEAQRHMIEVNMLCRQLLRHKQTAIAGDIIRMMEAPVVKSDMPYVMHRLAELKVDYYDACHDKEAMADALLKQHHLLLRYRQEQRSVYKQSIDLIRIVGELQDEEVRSRAENERLQVEAHTDALTGIPNRYRMDIEIGAAFEKACATGTTLGVGMLDINHFKAFNDKYGHQAGDACLTAVGGILKDIAQDERIFCVRYGGDEFLLLYYGMTSEEILAVGEKINAAAKEIRITVNRHTVTQRITIAQGVCNDVPDERSKPWDFLTEADHALYRLKSGKEYAQTTIIHNLPEYYR